MLTERSAASLQLVVCRATGACLALDVAYEWTWSLSARVTYHHWWEVFVGYEVKYHVRSPIVLRMHEDSFLETSNSSTSCLDHGTKNATMT